MVFWSNSDLQHDFAEWYLLQLHSEFDDLHFEVKWLRHPIAKKAKAINTHLLILLYSTFRIVHFCKTIPLNISWKISAWKNYFLLSDLYFLIRLWKSMILTKFFANRLIMTFNPFWANVPFLYALKACYGMNPFYSLLSNCYFSIKW